MSSGCQWSEDIIEDFMFTLVGFDIVFDTKPQPKIDFNSLFHFNNGPTEGASD